MAVHKIRQKETNWMERPKIESPGLLMWEHHLFFPLKLRATGTLEFFAFIP